MAKAQLRRIKIPEQHKKPLRELASLAQDQYATFLRTVADGTPTLSVDDFAGAVAERSGLNDETVRAIIGLLMSLSLTREYHGISIDRLVTDVLSRAPEDLDIRDPQEADRLAERLNGLLALERPLGVSARALGVLLEHERAFVEARIMTDIRPIFLAGDRLEPVATVIVHNLKIVSHTGDSHREHFFALDTADLRKLREVVERAILKEEALAKVIESTNLTFLAAND